MSYARLVALLDGTPWAIRDQVLSYARTVRDALPAILSEAELPARDEFVESLVFVAGLRKLYGICSSSYWTLSNTTAFLSEVDAGSVEVGATDASRDSALFRNLRLLREDLERALIATDLQPEVLMMNYTSLARVLLGRQGA